MATIKLKNGSGAPLASDLVQGEPALDLTNKRLYTEDTLGAVIEVGVNPTELNVTNNIVVGGTVDGRDIATDGAKLDNVEAGATADQTPAQIKTAYESNADTNAFTDADHTKLGGVEALADVTDTTNVTAAGALMDSELTSEASVKALNQGVATTDSPTFAGLTTTADVSFGDNDKAIFGAGSDLQIYHDGGHSYIDDAGTGLLRLRSNTIYLEKYTGELLADFNADGYVSLLHDNSEKFRTTSTGIDVTGTATMDGLTVDGTLGNWSVDTQGAIQDFSASGTNYIRATNAAGSLRFGSGGVNNRLNIANNGDVSLYEDTGTTAKFFWDASAESLGIGTSSPSSYDGNADNLVIGGDSAVGLTLASSATNGRGSIYFADGTSGDQKYRGTINYFHSSDDLTITTAATEAMRIDSSQNVLVGKTSVNQFTTAGHELHEDGLYVGTRDSGNVAVLNRETNDGSILQFRKDNATVGSIGTHNGQMIIGSADTGLGFQGDSTGTVDDAILPVNISTGARRDDAISLGHANGRFKDLYLSGGAYLGGTAAANKLDDYEEGTWTPVLTDGTTSYTLTNGVYTKVGRMVTVSFQYNFTLSTTATTGNAYIAGLPFNNGTIRAVGSIHLRESILTYDVATDGPIVPVLNSSSSSIDLIALGSANDYQKNITLDKLVSIGVSSNYITFTATYQTV